MFSLEEQTTSFRECLRPLPLELPAESVSWLCDWELLPWFWRQALKNQVWAPLKLNVLKRQRDGTDIITAQQRLHQPADGTPFPVQSPLPGAPSITVPSAGCSLENLHASTLTKAMFTQSQWCLFKSSFQLYLLL